jgi:UDP-N-acetylmuramoylalanine--D-glutamate ligase
MIEQKYRTFVGGNLGGSLLARLPEISKADVVVLELSSYMLEHLAPMRWSPRVAVVTMISNDHVEWHGGVEQYHDAKKNLVRFQKRDDHAIVSDENPISASFAEATNARIARYGLDGRSPFLLRIAGRHNQLNAQAAFAAAQCLGVTREQAQLGIAGFEGLPHRMQVVHEQDGITWINDSIATIPEAAMAANQSFPAGRVIQIVGGHDKKLDWSAMCRALAGGCKAVLTIGEIGPRLASMLRDARPAGKVWECGDLSSAVATAKSLAESGDVVLLSTGTASYDQFPNFEKRGDAFTALAREA